MQYLLTQLSLNQPLRPFRKTSSQVSLNAALQFLEDDKLLFTCLTGGSQGFKRSLPRGRTLQENPELAQLLQKVLASRWLDDKLDSNQPLNHCYKKGWLQAESTGGGKTIYTFPTRIHQRCVFFSIQNCNDD